jgi:hypothetical protein
MSELPRLAGLLLATLGACAPAPAPGPAPSPAADAAAQAAGDGASAPAPAAAQPTSGSEAPEGDARDGSPFVYDAVPAEAEGAEDDGLLDEALVKVVYAEAVAALRDGADIALPADVPAVLLTAAEASERRKAFARTLDEHAGLTGAMDLVTDFVMSDSMLGRYLPDEKVLYLIEDVLERHAEGSRAEAEELLFGVMAHELVHAYDDQVRHAMPSPAIFTELMQDGRRLPELQALMGVIEGHAVYAAELACRHAGRAVLDPITLEDARSAKVMSTRGSALQALGGGLVNGVARTKLVQYAWGREFCAAAHRFGGERFIGEVYAHLPLTLAELENFELFKQRWAREKEAELEAADASADEAPEDASAGVPVEDRD